MGMLKTIFKNNRKYSFSLNKPSKLSYKETVSPNYIKNIKINIFKKNQNNNLDFFYYVSDLHEKYKMNPYDVSQFLFHENYNQIEYIYYTLFVLSFHYKIDLCFIGEKYLFAIYPNLLNICYVFFYLDNFAKINNSLIIFKK